MYVSRYCNLHCLVALQWHIRTCEYVQLSMGISKDINAKCQNWQSLRHPSSFYTEGCIAQCLIRTNLEELDTLANRITYKHALQ